MARIKINGHDKFDGDYRVVTQSKMKIGTQLELQYQAGWDNKQMQDHLEQGSSLTAALIFASLWQAGMKPTWDEVLDIENGQIRMVREAGDPTDDAEDDTQVDPTSAPEASPRGDDAAPQAAPPSQQ
ncbi:hypothetical protein [Demequina gelatinilytica]|uniref:hypothetical protein n=1 Tax=Demequina gelatinilytica TaxID=1638980 RepID=UPI00078280D3|nr:hypothetical protein [Demequina gelatinilytica]